MSKQHFEVKACYLFQREINVVSKDRLKCTQSTPQPNRCAMFEIGRATNAITKQSQSKSLQEIGDLFVYISPQRRNRMHGNCYETYHLDVWKYKQKGYKDINVSTGLFDPENTNKIYFGDLGTYAILGIKSDDFRKNEHGRIIQGSFEFFAFQFQKENALNIYVMALNGELEEELNKARENLKEDNSSEENVYKLKRLYVARERGNNI